MIRTRKGEDGAVLVVVLWVVALLFAIIVGVSASVTSNAALSRALGRRVDLDAVRAAGIETAAAGLLANDPRQRWTADGRPYAVFVDNTRILVRVWDTSALVDVNRADPALLYNLFASLGGPAAAALVEQFVESRGNLTVATRDPGAAVGLGSPAAPTLSPEHRLAHEDDLRKILANDPVLASRLMPFLTVYGRTGHINPLLAPREVLAAVPDIAPAEVAALLARTGDGLTQDASAIAAKYAAYFDRGDGTLFRVVVDANGEKNVSTIYVRRGSPSPYYIIEQSAS